MKRCVVLVVVVLMVTGFGFAQEAYLGPRIGMPISWAGGDDWDDLLDGIDKSEPFTDFGFTGGLEFSYHFSESFSAETAVLWGVYTWAFESRNEKGDMVDVGCSLMFLEVPIVASYRVPVGPGSITLGAGPMLMFPTGDLSIDPIEGKTELKADESPDNAFVLGGTAGVGYDLPLGPGILGFDTRYVRTLTKLFEENGAGDTFPADFDEFYINAVAIYLSYGFAMSGM
jgi:hypothetical protein